MVVSHVWEFGSGLDHVAGVIGYVCGGVVVRSCGWHVTVMFVRVISLHV